MTDWLPIETAPRDGRLLLLVDATQIQKQYGLGVICGCWDCDEWLFVEDLDDIKLEGNSWNDGYGPTHWMPLPLPPTA